MHIWQCNNKDTRDVQFGFAGFLRGSCARDTLDVGLDLGFAYTRLAALLPIETLDVQYMHDIDNCIHPLKVIRKQ